MLLACECLLRYTYFLALHGKRKRPEAVCLRENEKMLSDGKATERT